MAAVPPEVPRDAEGADAEPVRPVPGAGPDGTGRIRKVVSAALSAAAPVRRGGTEGWESGRGGTPPGAWAGAPAPGLPAGGTGPEAGVVELVEGRADMPLRPGAGGTVRAGRG
ncbi:hypothetical protein ACI2L1_19755 [Streptomyces sp. NPDC019531]|uniref:hypothetical protein n=1 Tax=Streptomyces sp. NPDC019531 TaxID=3365062 RepID=UPI00384E3059